MSFDFERLQKEWTGLADAVLVRASELKLDAAMAFSAQDDLSVKVRLGKLEEIRQSAPVGFSIRVYKGKRSVSSSTSHMEKARLLALVDRLASTVDLVDEDDATGMPEKELLYAGGPDLDLYDPRVTDLTAELARDMAIRGEAAAMAADKRIKNSSGADVGLARGGVMRFNTQGLAAFRPGSAVTLSVSPVAEDDAGNKYSDGWFCSARHLGDLDDAEAVGKIAARRCLDQIGADNQVGTGRYPVLFAPETSMGLLTHLFECISGDRIYKGSSFLAGKEGQAVASELVTVIDDPLRLRGLSSAPFDNEGVATSTRTLVDRGILKLYPCDTFAARKLKRKSTGHSAGGGAIRSYNLHVANGTETREALLSKVGTGLLVNSFIGFSFNHATGDFSRGVRGFWIENGKVGKPIQEVTVSGNLGTMLQDVVAVGNDLELRYGTDSPSLLIREMVVSGS
jgi:PmbA protein